MAKEALVRKGKRRGVQGVTGVQELAVKTFGPTPMFPVAEDVFSRNSTVHLTLNS
jgi:hypothetical protein